MVMETAVYAITTALRKGVIFASCTPAQTETSKLAYGILCNDAWCGP